MPKYMPKSGEEGLVVSTALPRREVGVDERGNAVFDREYGAQFEVGGEEKPWPYETENPSEIDFLESHEQVKRATKADLAPAEEPKKSKGGKS